MYGLFLAFCAKKSVATIRLPRYLSENGSPGNTASNDTAFLSVQNRTHRGNLILLVI